jgi:hypothetical protein
MLGQRYGTLMLPELLAWFTGKEQNRRKFPRKRKPYRAAYSLDGTSTRAAIGLDLSGGGLCILTQEPVGRDDFEVRMMLDERNLRMRVKVVWHDNVQHQGRKVWRYGLRFTGIPADDWDAIIRYTTDRPVVERKRLAPLEERHTPLVQYFYSGIVRHNEKLMHRLVIQSKVVGPESDEMFETRFVFDESGKNVQILN